MRFTDLKQYAEIDLAIAIVLCILATIGALVWMGMITPVTGGVGAVAFSAVLAATGAICVEAVKAASTESKNSAQIRVWEAR